MQGLGVASGDRVAVLMPNTQPMLEAHYGVPMAGAVLVTLNTRLSSAELAYIIEHSGAGVLLYDHEFEAVVSELRGRLGDLTLRTVRASAGADDAYESLLAASPRCSCEIADERGMLAINYTSGTTGKPKGVMYHHRGALPAVSGDGAADRTEWRQPLLVDAADVPLQRLVFSMGGHRGRWDPCMPADASTWVGSGVCSTR